MTLLLHPIVESAFEDHPILLELLTSGILWGFADFLSQIFEYRARTLKIFPRWSRVFRLAFYAAFFWAPATHVELKCLYYYFPEETFQSLLLRVAIDQIIYSSIVYSSLFYFLGWSDGFSSLAGQLRVKKLFFPTLIQSWILWPIVEFLNFAFVPLEFQMILSNLVNVPWTGFLAYRAAAIEIPNENSQNSNLNEKSNFISGKLRHSAGEIGTREESIQLVSYDQELNPN